ncbi:hypothetical protein DZF91_37280 [Actinomadura logoneensis]|uniref:Uncharacterized protein n=1 Tax=Actinomadura logoneensis TaxID=2293572 RepID=A0A372J9L7_9ACTN|nr:hypothetical protein DZF91_37280 [Actinomadura logoneensis]
MTLTPNVWPTLLARARAVLMPRPNEQSKSPTRLTVVNPREKSSLKAFPENEQEPEAVWVTAAVASAKKPPRAVRT